LGKFRENFPLIVGCAVASDCEPSRGIGRRFAIRRDRFAIRRDRFAPTTLHAL